MNRESRAGRILVLTFVMMFLILAMGLSAQAGFVNQDGKRYFYDPSGRQVTGWMKKGTKTYFLDPADGGAAAVGYRKIGVRAYFFRANGSMVRKSFIRDAEGNMYYAVKSGALRTGLRKIRRRYYFFDPTSNIMQTGWVNAKGNTYYMKGAGKQKGSAVIGWLRKDGLKYYFDKKGRMVHGLVRIGLTKYYFDPDTGAMVTGEVRINGQTYHFGQNGIPDNPTGPWNIKVNQSTCTVTVYRGSTPVKAFACSVGVDGKTPDGTFRIQDHLRWHELMGPSWGQWCSHITSDILFHSIPYNGNCDKYSMSSSAYNMLGRPASHGCIRLAAVNAKYIYDNVPIGTTVVIFHGSGADDPLGKPQTPYVGNWGHTYDPTDPTI